MLFLDEAPTSICHFFHPSVRQTVRPSVHPSVAYYISGTVHHLIIIFSTHVYNDDISRLFFNFLEILIFWAVRQVKGQKIAQNEK